MALDSAKKLEIIANYGRSEGDTGSSEVQIALLTARIVELTDHLKIFKEKWNDYPIQTHDDKVFIMVERDFLNPVELIKHILDTDEKIFENCSKVKIKYSNAL